MNVGSLRLTGGYEEQPFFGLLTFFFFSSLNSGNKTATVTLLSHFTYMVIPGALLAVDTFFLLR